jgi:cytochrome c5
MKRFGAIVLVTMLLAGCGQASQPSQPSQPTKPTQNPSTQTSSTSAPKQGPPKIPHKVTEGMVCKECHATGTNGAPISKHPERPNCTMCHKVAE